MGFCRTLVEYVLILQVIGDILMRLQKEMSISLAPSTNMS